MTNADFTIRDVLAWARTKPADEAYRYGSTQDCALCQFVRETGRADHPTFGGYTWTEWNDAPYVGRGQEHTIPREADEAVRAGEYTFGALVKRLEKLCPDAPVTIADWLTIDAYLTDIEDVARERCSA